MKHLIPIALLALTPIGAWAQASVTAPEAGSGGSPASAAVTASAVRITAAPQVDGRLDDAVWAQAPVINTFTQRDPDEGRPASEATEVRIAYDNEAIYVAARMHDRSGVTSRLGRRDMPITSSDWFRISFDSFRDRRNAFRFDVNPAGVRRDATIAGDIYMRRGGGGPGGGGGGGAPGGGGGGGQPGGGGGFAGSDGELAWDAVWDAAATTDDGGWTAELRIPFSQLRFTPADEQTWGFQIERIIDRNQELDLFAFTPKSRPGGVPVFGDLTGLRGIRPGRPLELMPYVLSQGQFKATASNPFVSDREADVNAGLDARYRITSNLTLSATINPDFGQVEVDPAIINLSAFETRLEEKRPFFVEGASNFRFAPTVIGLGAATGLLYSRRIGRVPQLGVPTQPSDIPGTTGILGAAKISGKTAGGWSLGILEAVTGEENARYLDRDGVGQSAVVEPMTNYFLTRVNREMRRGQSSIGGIVTAVNRRTDVDRVGAALRSAAYTGGIDFNHEFANRVWNFVGFVAGSQVRGSEGAITLTQRSSARYFNRPDAGHVELDPNATSLGGMAGQIDLRKASGLHWTGNLAASFISPGYEINDMGFQQRSDRRAVNGRISYNERRPGPVLRSYSVSLLPEVAQNFDGDFIEKAVRAFIMTQHTSYWGFDASLGYNFERIDDRLTRGGPLAIRPASYMGRLSLESDPRKPIGGELDFGFLGDEGGSWARSVELTLDINTSPTWNLSLGPSYTKIHQDAQYVTSINDPAMTATFGRRYVFAPLDQTELGVVTRFNYTFNPDLTFELYAQPLVSNGEYRAPTFLARPRSYEFEPYSGKAPDRSFTTRSLRGNAVLRWEYRPGSTLYLVWQQERLNDELLSDFDIGGASRSLFDAPASNVLVLKASYWLNP
ncbi:MAG: carbohydrate binding family 9 domain-containing protein [Gemmatimonadetes bacterium]|nr:carbohydrate binding family 9 domain-containing protein [Gemmatimonadota bacterium]